MQRFYMFHSFTKFHRNFIAAAALFLAAKASRWPSFFRVEIWWKVAENWLILVSIQVEEQPRKLEHVIKVSHVCLNRDQPHLDSKSEKYLEQVTVDGVWLQLGELNVLSGSGVGQQWEHSAPDPGLWRSYRPPSHPRGEMLSAGQRSVTSLHFLYNFGWSPSIPLF